jgi:hypothetical protein
MSCVAVIGSITLKMLTIKQAFTAQLWYGELGSFKNKNMFFCPLKPTSLAQFSP